MALRKPMLRLALCSLAAALLLPPSSHGQPMIQGMIDAEGVHIEVLSGPQSNATHGYQAHLFRVTNHGDAARHVRLSAPKTTFSSRADLRSLTREFDVPAGKTTITSLLQPPLQMEGHGLEIAIDGKVQPRGMAVNLPFIHGQHGLFPLHLLMSADVQEETRWRLERVLHTLKVANPQQRPSILQNVRWTFDLEHWPSDWLAYLNFDGIVLRLRDGQNVPAGVRAALERYV